MNKEEELLRLERSLESCNREEVCVIVKKIRVIEKEIYPQNEVRFKSILEFLDDGLEKN